MACLGLDAPHRAPDGKGDRLAAVARSAHPLFKAAGVETIDLDVEGIVDRIGSMHGRIKRAHEEVSREHGLTHPEFSVLSRLRLARRMDAARPAKPEQKNLNELLRKLLLAARL